MGTSIEVVKKEGPNAKKIPRITLLSVSLKDDERKKE